MARPVPRAPMTRDASSHPEFVFIRPDLSIGRKDPQTDKLRVMLECPLPDAPRKSAMIHFTAVTMALMGMTGPALAAAAQDPADATVETREVLIWSDGTRMRGDLYLPKGRDAAAK